MAMNIQRRCEQQNWPEDTQRNLTRLFELWRACRAKYAADGPWLFGERSIADAFYAPVVTRLRTYSVPLDDVCQYYSDTVLGDSDFQAWEKDSTTGVWDESGFSIIDNLYR